MTDSHDRSAASIACEWWKALRRPEGVPSGRQRAALARLRRAATPLEVMLEPEALRLIARLRDRHNPDRVAALIGVLAFVRNTDDRRVACVVGRKSLDDERPPLLSEGRFRRLLQMSHDELMGPMRRLVHLAGGTINVQDLSDAVLYWGDSVKKRWIFDYYGVGVGAGSETGTPVSSTDAT